jgi:hypothetical protein
MDPVLELQIEPWLASYNHAACPLQRPKAWSDGALKETRRILCVALVFALCCSMTVEGQNQSSVASRVTEVLKAKEPGWTFVGAIESGRVC